MSAEKSVTKKYCGRYNSSDVYIYELRSGGMRVGICNVGAAIAYIRVPAPEGERSVCPEFLSAAARIEGGTYCGATIGRVANRISGGSFSLGGKVYSLDKNDGQNCLHGGFNGFDRRIFAARCGDGGVEMELLSPDGDQGFGGNLRFKALFEAEGSALNITYSALADAVTPFAPTCHTYFNLGDECGEGTFLSINAEDYTPVGQGLIPTGEIAPVRSTPFDFNSPANIAERVALSGGYDHNFVLKGGVAARAECNGVGLEVSTDMPGLQFYSGGCFTKEDARGAVRSCGTFALEAQFFPDALNRPGFPSPVIPAGVECSRRISYKFFRL